MSRSANQKLKLLYLSKILKERTDDEHYITMPEILDALASYGIEANRKSIYTDMDALEQYGMDIIKTRIGPQTYYHCGDREFEIAELKFLVDAIQASKFISEKKTRELIKKLETNLSTYDATLLEREVTVTGRVKNMNESVYYSIDAIHNAMNNDKCIQFRYFSWNLQGKEEFRRNGDFYKVSPWALHFDDEKYYLVAYDMDRKEMRHYRVDKMRDVSVTNNKRKGITEFKKQNKAKYTQQHFRMFGGEVETVTLKCRNDMANVIVDQFGKNVMMIPVDDEYFKVNVEVAVSDQFFGWVVGIGGFVTIEAPENVTIKFKECLNRFKI